MHSLLALKLLLRPFTLHRRVLRLLPLPLQPLLPGTVWRELSAAATAVDAREAVAAGAPDQATLLVALPLPSWRLYAGLPPAFGLVALALPLCNISWQQHLLGQHAWMLKIMWHH